MKGIVSFHPSFQIEEVQGGNLGELVKKINQPQLLVPAGNDPQNVKVGGEFTNMFNLNSNGNCLCCPQEAVTHGFVVRGDLNDETTLKAFEETMVHTKAFLEKYL